jgi:dephospho-CoA kinase
MKRVLITGMSGTGKTAVIQELAARGYRAFDLDTPQWSQWVDADPSDTLTPVAGKDWVWREDRIRALLCEPVGEMLFVSGCAENMSRLFSLIDVVILLSTPTATIMERLAARSAEGLGHAGEQRAKVAQLIATIEPLLRKAADVEIDTTRSVAATADEVLRAVTRRSARRGRDESET